MRTIELTQGMFAQVDDEDYDWLNQWKWYAIEKENGFYARRADGAYMHNLVFGVKKEMIVDHINHGTLNNQKNNLRHATVPQNQYNQKPRGGTSEYKGVGKYKGSYRAKITLNYKTINIGLFDNEIACANAYNYFARRLFGEFARLNEVPYMTKEEWLSYKRGSRGVDFIEQQISQRI